jgi:hypothetical protein
VANFLFTIKDYHARTAPGEKTNPPKGTTSSVNVLVPARPPCPTHSNPNGN